MFLGASGVVYRRLNAGNLIWCYKKLYSSSQQRYEEDVNEAVKRIKKELETDKAKLRWRTPIGDRPEDWNSKLKVFGNSEQTADYIILMQKPIDVSFKNINQWWKNRRERTERFMQQYVAERHKILGPDLAAAHFILYRGGAAKFLNSQWIRVGKDEIPNLPNKFDNRFKLEALRCDDMLLYYEGLENLRYLQHLKFLSFRNVKTFDDWCLDRVSGGEYPKLEVLDISGTQCTSNGLACLYRLPTLKLLIVDNPNVTLEYQLSCAMLEETILQLKIVEAAAVHDV